MRFLLPMHMPSGRATQPKLKDAERRDMAAGFFSRLTGEGLSDQQLFARIMQDVRAQVALDQVDLIDHGRV